KQTPSAKSTISLTIWRSFARQLSNSFLTLRGARQGSSSSFSLTSLLGEFNLSKMGIFAKSGHREDLFSGHQHRIAANFNLHTFLLLLVVTGREGQSGNTVAVD